MVVCWVEDCCLLENKEPLTDPQWTQPSAGGIVSSGVVAQAEAPGRSTGVYHGSRTGLAMRLPTLWSGEIQWNCIIVIKHVRGIFNVTKSFEILKPYKRYI